MPDTPPNLPQMSALTDNATADGDRPETARRSGRSLAGAQRILQVDGRRYSLRLETCFWDALTELAAEAGTRVSRLVAEIDARRPAGSNLSSAIRAYCVEALKEQVIRLSSLAGRTSLLQLVHSAPAPGLMIAVDQTVIAANERFVKWLNVPAEEFVGQPLLRHFRFRAAASAENVWDRLAAAGATEQKARIIHIAPGRVLAGNALIVPVSAECMTVFYLIWVVI
jgi:predicted DNA-binding ribbon-helix-helix protein